MTTDNSKKARVAVITVLVLVLGFFGFKYIVSSAPKPTKQAAQKVARLVDAVELKKENARPQWQAGGTVVAAESVELPSQVSGKVSFIAKEAVPGAMLKEGTLLARIDNTDYRLALKQAEASLAQAKADLAIEQGQVALAREEYELSGTRLSDTDKALVLRTPQLQAAEASVATAQAAVDQAKTNLSRTEVRMPFDGRVASRDISTGSYASANSQLFSLVATSEFWIETKIPRRFLNLLDYEVPVTVGHEAWGRATREAYILNVLPGVAEGDRQVQVVLSLPEPLNKDLGPVVLVNDYVELTLYGHLGDSTYVIPREYLTDASTVWVVNDDELAERNVDVAYAGRDSVWIHSGFNSDDLLLTSQVDAAVPGMAVRVAGRAKGDDE